MIEELLDQMTLEEQVGLLAGADFWTTVPVERLGVPKIKVTDGPNGARGGGSLVGGVKSACFPVGIALGASWDVGLARAVGVALAEEARTKAARVLLGPTVNIQRSGLNGRNFECYSEDPHLTAELAVAYVEGLQSLGVAATVKHFVGNESEIERTTISSDIGERSLREIYLPPFEAAVKRAGAWAVMTGYNRLNGTFASEHRWLIEELLRGEWGFDGLVMSDWFGSHSTESTVNAGLDLEMPGPTRDRGARLVAAVAAGRVRAETVRARARNVLRLIERVGGFTDPAMPAERAVDEPRHRRLIREAGAAGAVLLKNDGILPLERAAVGAVAVIGPNAAEARVMGGGSAQINAHYRVSPLEGVRAALAGSNRIVHVRGCGNDRLVARVEGPVEVELHDGVACEGPVVGSSVEPFGEMFWGDRPEGVAGDAFSARIRARFRPEAGGEHVFGVTSAGLAKLYVDGALVVNSWDGWTRGPSNFFGTANEEVRASRTLEAGRDYAIEVVYRTPEAAAGLGVRALRFGVERPLGDEGIEEAVARAAGADVAIVCVGRSGEWDCEGNDLPGLALPGRQDELVARVAAANPRTVVVLQTGGPVLMPWLGEVAAVVQAWYPGQEAGNAVADVLFGDAEPGGRLPQTFPRRLEENSAFTSDPLTYPGKDGHVAYREGVFVGYRHFDRAGTGTLFPFGFGLSYTTFGWGPVTLSAPTLQPGGSVTVTVPVTNIGERAGSDVVQIYVRPLESRVERPVKELRGFAKLALGPGESGEAAVTLTARDLAFFDADAGSWLATAGHYEVLAASDAESVRSAAELRLESDWVEPVRRG
jgi:beta-glucosidase